MTDQVMEQPIFGAGAAITPSNATAAAGDVVPGRQLAILCTVAGNVKIRLQDSTTFTFPVAVGMLLLPWAVTQVFITGTTATATYFNLR